MYTVITYIFGGYEKPHSIKVKDPDARYIMVVDEPIEAPDWEVVVDGSLSGTPFNKTLQVRYNPWKYTDTDWVFLIDGSMGINKSLQKLVEHLDSNGYELLMEAHPTRNTIFPEYVAWVNQRGLNYEEAQSAINFIHTQGYDTQNDKGLFQFNFMAVKSVDWVKEWQQQTYDLCVGLAASEGDVHRVDQCIGSFTLQHYYKDKPICVCHQDICYYHFTWYAHNSDIPLQGGYITEMPYLYNKSVPILFIYNL